MLLERERIYLVECDIVFIYIWNNAVTDHDPGPDDTVVSDDDSTDVSDAGDVMEETENTDIEHNEQDADHHYVSVSSKIEQYQRRIRKLSQLDEPRSRGLFVAKKRTKSLPVINSAVRASVSVDHESSNNSSCYDHNKADLNNNEQSVEKTERLNEESTSVESCLPSVRLLARKFSYKRGTSKLEARSKSSLNIKGHHQEEIECHSITARSLSRQFR